MKKLWSFIAEIYCELAVAGLKISPPNFLFNNPKFKLHCQWSATILADINFTTNERVLILEALDDLHKFCNGVIHLEIVFELDPNDTETINNNYVLLRVDPTHPAIVDSDEKVETTTLGLCEYMKNRTIRLYLVTERLQNPTCFRTTTIHELGHFIGLGHTDKPSIMHKHNYSNVLYPTYKDAVEIAKVAQIPPEWFRYFKL